MLRFLKKYIAVLLASTVNLAIPSVSFAAETVIATGQAFITSTVGSDLFRTRAIEYALQQVVLGSDQSLNSFSVVENGKVLLDQIQTSSNIKILQYDIIEESIRNKKYLVKISAQIVKNDLTTQNDSACRQTSLESINFSMQLHHSERRVPVWANISKDWVLSEVSNETFIPKLDYFQSSNQKPKNQSLYTLFEKEELFDANSNKYEITMEIFLDQKHIHNVLEKTTMLSAKIRTILLRDNREISQLEFTQPYRIEQEILNGVFRTAARQDWQKIKKHLSNLIKTRLNYHISDLNCLDVKPRVIAKSGKLFLDYGLADGIQKKDMFVIKSNDTRKTYLKIIEIKKHEATLEVVSQKQNVENLTGKFVELVSGS